MYTICLQSDYKLMTDKILLQIPKIITKKRQRERKKGYCNKSTF